MRGPSDFKTLVFEPFCRAFPDVKLTVLNIIAEQDQAAVHWTVSGTHKGPFLDLPASGRRVKFSGTTWLKFKEGKIIAGADSYNFHGLLKYLADGSECASVRGG